MLLPCVHTGGAVLAERFSFTEGVSSDLIAVAWDHDRAAHAERVALTWFLSAAPPARLARTKSSEGSIAVAARNTFLDGSSSFDKN